MAGPWDDYAAAPVAEQKPWEDFRPTDQQSAAPTNLTAGLPGTAIWPVLKAFGRAASEDWKEPLGLTPESTQALSKAGIFAPTNADRYTNPFHAMNEILVNTIVGAGDIAMRSGSSLLHGGQAAVFTALGEGSLARDFAALPEAFFGSPHPTGTPKAGAPKANFSVRWNENEGQFQAVSADGKIIGHLDDTFPAGGDKAAFTAHVFVDEEWRRKGVASAMYEKFSERHEGNIKPAGNTSLDAWEFWLARYPEKVADAVQSEAHQVATDIRENGFSPSYAEEAANGYSHPRVREMLEDAVRTELEGPKPLDLASARDLGVIGPERPPITEGTPKEAAARAVAADQPRDATVKGEVAGEPNAWRERFDKFVGKLKTPEEMQQLIKDAADQNDEFPAARQGDIPLKQFEDITTAAGVEPGTVDRNGVGRLLQNDNQVRNAMEAMLTATEQVKAAAREVKADASPENLMKLQEAMFRRDAWVEQVVGHRAEWGRTGNVFQEFLERAKDEKSFGEFLRDNDRSPKGLRKIADAVDALDSGKAARFLSDSNKPGFFDKFMWYLVNALISGPVTHTKYFIANTVFAGYEAGVVTPIAGAIGTVRRAATGSREGVFMGETAAGLWGIVAGVPDAVVAATKAARTGLQTPLPGELAQNIIPKRNRDITFQQKPIPGAVGTVIGLPSKGASAIHTFFNFMGYRAGIEKRAYSAAAKEGLNPTDDTFWQRRSDFAANPTKEMMDGAIEDGYRLTYISELGEKGKALSAFVHKIPGLRMIMPFTHIPANILKRGIEGTPIAFIDGETRTALAGKAGAVKQDMAIARIVAGTGIGIWAVNLVANDRMTGYGPTDPKERAQWLATGHQPYSIRIGDYWYSFNRFGSIGTMLGLHANLAEAIPHMKADSEELTKAVAMTVKATGRLIEDEVGMQGLAGLIEAINEPERKGVRVISSFAGSMLPFSSALRQTASAMDPSMREAKTVVDGLRYYIPVVRQGLLPKRDWTGSPIANAGYGGDLPVPGASAIIQHRAVGTDPISLEMKTLDLHPAPPQDRIGGVKLPPKLYDEYQTVAGSFTRTTLESMVRQPGWYSLPPFVREEVFRRTIRSTREAAAATLQAAHPEIIQTGIDNKVGHINGVKPVKLKDAP